MLGIFGQILGPVSNLAGTWLQGRVDKAKAETDVKVAKAKAEAKVYETSATSEMLNEQALTAQMAGSWKDEFWTLVLALPIFMVGYAVAFNDPSVLDRVHASFDALSNLPEWYSYLLFIAVSASFGIRGADKLMKMRK